MIRLTYFALFLFSCFQLHLVSCIQIFAAPWTAACQASLSITISWNLLKLMSIELVMPSNHLIFCCPLLLLPSIFPSISVFSFFFFKHIFILFFNLQYCIGFAIYQHNNESVLHIRWPNYWSSASASVLPMNIQDWFPLRLTDLISLQSKGLLAVQGISLQSKGLSRAFSKTTVKNINSLVFSFLYSITHIHTWLLEKPQLWLDGPLLAK